MNNNNVNMDELKKVVDEMVVAAKGQPTYNQAAADLIAAGVKAKLDARNGYQTILTPPVK